MLYLFYGTDEQKARKKVRSTVDALLKREPDASHVRFDTETFTADILSEHLGGRGLFGKRVLVVLDRVFENPESQELVLERVKDIADSENIFIVLDGKLNKKTAGKLERSAEKVQVFDLQQTTNNKQKDFNIFSLTDALGNRDKKKLWVLYQRAMRANYPPEEMHGLLFWQTKTMLLVAQKATKGLKPFVIGKAKRFLNNWTEDELKTLSSNLVSIFHNARRGGPSLDIALEQFILTTI